MRLQARALSQVLCHLSAFLVLYQAPRKQYLPAGAGAIVGGWCNTTKRIQKNGGRAQTQLHVCTDGTSHSSRSSGGRSGNAGIHRDETRATEGNDQCRRHIKERKERIATRYLGSALCTKEGYESDFQSRDIKKLWFIYTAGYSATRLRLRRNVLAHRNSIAGVLPVERKGDATPCDLKL